eukprot:9750752-Alexandrium_andersonii.AAC.1
MAHAHACSCLLARRRPPWRVRADALTCRQSVTSCQCLLMYVTYVWVCEDPPRPGVQAAELASK